MFVVLFIIVSILFDRILSSKGYGKWAPVRFVMLFAGLGLWLLCGFGMAVLFTKLSGGESGFMTWVGLLSGPLLASIITFVIIAALPEKNLDYEPEGERRLPKFNREEHESHLHDPIIIPGQIQKSQNSTAFEPPPPSAEIPHPDSEPEASALSSTEVLCPHCEGALALTPEHSGIEIACPHCSGQFLAPEF